MGEIEVDFLGVDDRGGKEASRTRCRISWRPVRSRICRQ